MRRCCRVCPTCKDDGGDDRRQLSGKSQAQDSTDRPGQPQLGKFTHKLHSKLCFLQAFVSGNVEFSSGVCIAVHGMQANSECAELLSNAASTMLKKNPLKGFREQRLCTALGKSSERPCLPYASVGSSHLNCENHADKTSSEE